AGGFKAFDPDHSEWWKGLVRATQGVVATAGLIHGLLAPKKALDVVKDQTVAQDLLAKAAFVGVDGYEDLADLLTAMVSDTEKSASTITNTQGPAGRYATRLDDGAQKGILLRAGTKGTGCSSLGLDSSNIGLAAGTATTSPRIVLSNSLTSEIRLQVGEQKAG